MRQRYVYFARRASDGAVKIGVSCWPDRRMVNLGYTERCKITLLKTIKGGITGERALHRKFAAFRLYGEWFSPAPELLSFIEVVTCDDILTDEQRKADIEKRRAEGVPVAIIAAHYGVTRQRLHSILTERCSTEFAA